MGYIKHHAIVVTSWDKELIKEARQKAIEIFGKLTSEIIGSNINGYNSFFIAPDGSKEGWDESNKGDDDRKAFIVWINSKSYEDGSNCLRYAELFYNEDNGLAGIVNHN